MGLSTYINVSYYSKGSMAKSQLETKLQSKEEHKQKKRKQIQSVSDFQFWDYEKL